MKSAISYRPGRDALHRAGALPAICFLGAFLVLGFTYSSPLVVAAIGVAAIGMGLAAGARAAIWLSVRWGAAVALLMAAINPIVNNRGDTVLARLGHWPLLGEVNVTFEAIVQGGAIGLRLMGTLILFAVYSVCVNPDEVLRLLRPLARRSALTATLVSRMVPVAAADLMRLSEAAQLRGPAAASVGRGAMLRRIVAGSLDRSIDVAATLELRGYSLRPVPGSAAPRRRSLVDRAFFAVAAVVLLGGLGARLAGAGGFDAFPSIELATGPGTLALCALLPVAALAPFAPERLGTRRA